MPAFVGPIQLNTIGRSAIFTVGDSFALSPKSQSQSSIGSGSANTGDFIENQNFFSISNFYDADIIDQVDVTNM
ncbi:spore germination protein [Metabacillus litoralis]|uniref:spore germination protein n=1 Tax=Metabacillus litoralis TaxID=152268 RepID=UPI001CFE66D2|nr:spore germination protein [Metabacillus litoralis]